MTSIRKHFVWIIGILAATCSPPANEIKEAVPTSLTSIEHYTVFAAGEEGYDNFRIPSIIKAQNGDLLAFAEGRNWPSDHAENDIVMKRSQDGGRTWGDFQVIAQDGENNLNNPLTVVLPDNGRIIMLYQLSPKGFHARAIQEHNVQVLRQGHSGLGVRRCFAFYSDDHGATWSTPKDITASVKQPTKMIGLGGGPGIGLVMENGPNKGRIVMPFRESWYEGPDSTSSNRQFNVFAVYSDNNGDSWQRGETAPHDQDLPGQNGWGNEAQMVELTNGTIMINSRGNKGNRYRKVATSTDGGQSWSTLVDDLGLPEPQCMASILSLMDPENGGRKLLLYSGPATQKGRTRGTVRVSYDEGKIWPISQVIVPEGRHFAYSCLVAIDRNTVGCFYETDKKGENIRLMNLAVIPLSWLEGKL